MGRWLTVAVVVGAVAAPGVARAQDQDQDVARMKSPAMVAGGIGMMTVGSVAIGLGIPFIVLGSRTLVVASVCPGCTGSSPAGPNMDYLAGGILAVTAGALAVLGGIPLVYFGAKHDRRGVWLTAGGFAGRF
jgi:hypothetical protein